MNRDIRISFDIRKTPQEVASALMNEADLQNWWTKECSVQNGKGSFHWKENGWTVELTMSVRGAEQVVWKCTKSNMQNTDAWEGSTITFNLFPEGRGVTQVNFMQTGYKISPCFDVCVGGWHFVLQKSLKSYLETGKGIPYPEVRDTQTLKT
jgi:uncharacterized protein YndB with AHSA1/START domain